MSITSSEGATDRVVPELLEAEEQRRALSGRKRAWISLTQNIPAMGALITIILLLLIAVFSEIDLNDGEILFRLSPHDPLDQELIERLKPPVFIEGGSPEYLLGTDKLGRDILSRIIFGARISLVLATVATTLSLILGVSIGVISGYVGGKTDDFIQRFADLWLAFPALVLFIAVIAVFGTSFLVLVLVLAIGGWVSYARVARGQVLSVKEKEYVEAARLTGASPLRIMYRHILPNVTSPLIVIFTFSVASIILIESALSFLGLGVQPPTPAWGSMLADGRELIATAWWLATFPGLAIMLTVLAVNIFGDALRDILDPRLR